MTLKAPNEEAKLDDFFIRAHSQFFFSLIKSMNDDKFNNNV